MIKVFAFNPVEENTYVVSDDATKECVIIDCGAYYEGEGEAVAKYITENGLKPVHLIATHGHFDHNFGNGVIYKTFGLKAEIHEDDAALLQAIGQQTMDFFGIPLHGGEAPIGRYLHDGDTITYGTQTLRVMHTPGHTEGGTVIYNEQEQTAFTGDTIFRMSIGRTDLDGGNMEKLMASLQRIVSELPEETVLYPGHGPKTTVAAEKKGNPYIKGGM
ncbi:MAG: MBL fold metallo-hydrolase [Bacteroidaceae bacterium]|nr:MBL fold metallo-hydrolase [Bacteroidaceae bacterium]